MEQPDQTLIERFRDQGDEAAFDTLVSRHQRDVYRLAYRIAGSHEDASDLAQEAFVRVYRGLKRFRGDSSFKTWLYRIVVNLSLNHIRKMRKERDGHVRVEDIALPVAARGLQSVLDAEVRTRLDGAIKRLPEKQKKTLILKVFHELKYVEIARVMSCSVGTAKANFFHAVQSLKRESVESGEEESVTIHCHELAEVIAEVLGAEATPERALNLERHLAACAACASAHHELAEVLVRARAMTVPEPPAEYWSGFHTKLRRRIEEEKAGGRTASLAGLIADGGFLSWLRPALAAAALAGLSFFGAVRPAPAPAPALARPAASAPAIDARDAASLAAALDLIDVDGALPASGEALDALSAGAAEAFVSSPPSGDIFGFFDSAEPLSSEQTEAVLAALETRFAG